VASEVDWCIAQSTTTLAKLPEDKSSIIRPGVGEHFKEKRVRIGIVGRTYTKWGDIALTDRKRYHWIDELVMIDDIDANFEFLFTDGKIIYENMHKFYKDIDYLLVTADNEGGPMPVAEALSMGVPVIAPRGVGWCEEFSVLNYTDFDSLVSLLSGLYWPRNDWQDSANKIIHLVNNLL
jgi:glycosyltransferase involved in cell wall biosynthesis